MFILQQGKPNGPIKTSYSGLNNGNKTFADYLVFEVDHVNKETHIRWDIPRSEGVFGKVTSFTNRGETNWKIDFAIKAIPFFSPRGRASNYEFTLTSVVRDDYISSNIHDVLPKLNLGFSTARPDTRPEYAAVDPIDKNTDGVLKVCLNRAHADCDYAADQIGGSQ